MRIVFSGGGTGGHIYPALAIREILKTRHTFESFYVGVNGGMEETIAGREADLTFLGVRAMGMPRKLCMDWFRFPFVNAGGVFDAYGHLKSVRPDLVVTTGGYVAFPVLAASKLLGIKTVIHEQNAAMGVTNRLFASSAGKVLLTYESAAEQDGERVVLTGNPVRSAFLTKEKAGGRFAKKAGEFILLAVGGSRGALSLNRACIEIAQKFLRDNHEFKLIHISGERDYEMVKKATENAPENYQLLPYLHEMKDAFDVADLLVSRAGATILAEIGVCRKPAVLVPFPFATDNHQEKNARVLEKLGAAKMLLDKDLSGDSLISIVKEIRSSGSLNAMAEAMEKSRPADVENRILEQISALLEK